MGGGLAVVRAANLVHSIFSCPKNGSWSHVPKALDHGRRARWWQWSFERCPEVGAVPDEEWCRSSGVAMPRHIWHVPLVADE